MRSFLCVAAYALVAAGLCVAAAPASAGCTKLVGTADGWDKRDALSGAQAALAEAVAEFKKGKGAVTVIAMKAETPTLLARFGVGGALPQARCGDGEVAHRVLEGRGLAGRVHLWRQGLLVGWNSMLISSVQRAP